MTSTYTRSSSKQDVSSQRQHPYEYIDEKSINPLLLCSECEKPFVDPVTAYNGQRGCRSCLPSSPLPTPIQEWIVLEMLNSLEVKCLQCGELKIRRGKLEEHENNSCKQALVPCGASDIKCPWKGAREQLKQHMTTCVFEPLRPALSAIITVNTQFEEKIEKLERLVEELREQR